MVTVEKGLPPHFSPEERGDPRGRGTLVGRLQAPGPGLAPATARPQWPARPGQGCSRTRQDVRRAGGRALPVAGRGRGSGRGALSAPGPETRLQPATARARLPALRVLAFPPSARRNLSPAAPSARPRRLLPPERAPRARAPGPRERAPLASYLRALPLPRPLRLSGSDRAGPGGGARTGPARVPGSKGAP